MECLPFLFIVLILCVIVPSFASLYDENDDVIELTASNFEEEVLNSDEIWMVKFFAPWGGHCKAFAPKFKITATAMKGIAKLGAVDMTMSEPLTEAYGIRGYPTFKIFGIDKTKPYDYRGDRSSEGFSEAVLAEIKTAVSHRLHLDLFIN